MKTYTRQPNRRRRDTQPTATTRIVYRMGVTGHVVEDTVRAETPDPVALPEPVSEKTSGKKQTPKAAPPKPVTAVEPASSPLSEVSNPFSDDEGPEDIFSPPSSPPYHQRRSSTPQLKRRKPAFSFLSRKRKRPEPDSDTESPLAEIDLNATHARKCLPLAKKPRLTQMRIDLGGEVQRTCKECGMEYVPSHEEDAALHKSFHGLNIDGVELGKGFVKEVGALDRLDDKESVVLVDGKSSAHVRKKVRKVLDVVKTDLGAVEVEDERLWGAQEKSGSKSKTRVPASTFEEGGKVYLYCIGDKCVGLCLAERIQSASKVVARATDDAKSSLTTEPSIAPMLLGISRIWTSKSHRRRGIASVLLDNARAHYFYGIEVPRKMIAFSQPTESGSKLAERWFSRGRATKHENDADRWHVYVEAD